MEEGSITIDRVCGNMVGALHFVHESKKYINASLFNMHGPVAHGDMLGAGNGVIC